MIKFAALILSVLVLFNLCGCVPLLAGAAGGTGTAFWLSGKLTEEVNAPFDKTLAAIKKGLAALRLKVTKETVKEDVAQVMSKYTDGRVIWIDVHRVSDRASSLEVRVGAKGDKEAAQKILDKIMKYL